MEKAFSEVFLRSLSRALKETVSDSEVQDQFSTAIKKCLKSGAISPELIKKNLDEVTLSCLGTLSADVSLRSMYEKQEDPLQETKRLVSEELVRMAGDKALGRLRDGCNMEQAMGQFGQEKLEEIAEKVSTQDIYLRPEFEESLEALKQIIQDAIQG